LDFDVKESEELKLNAMFCELIDQVEANW